MEIYTNNLIEAFKQYRVEVAQAVAFTHRDYTASGITRERASRVAEARKRLITRIPAKPGERGGPRPNPLRPE